jgi:SAM-dependent methyltransferase
MTEMTATSTSVVCPLCEVREVSDLGVVRFRPGIFPEAVERLYRCVRCGFLFRRPDLSEEALLGLHRNLPGDLWQNTAKRNDFTMARGLVTRRLDSGRVLDIGCYSGDFLASLPEGFDRFGVEPIKAVTPSLRARGITWLGTSLDSLREGSAYFDVVTLFDVFEHLVDPVSMLRKVGRALKPGGFVILSTGNSDALPWRILRRHYWYYYSEHLSFFNTGCLSVAANRAGLGMSETFPFSHFCGGRAYAGAELILALFFRAVGPWLYAGLASVLKWPATPITCDWKDHMLVVLTRADDMPR